MLTSINNYAYISKTNLITDDAIKGEITAGAGAEKLYIC